MTCGETRLAGGRLLEPCILCPGSVTLSCMDIEESEPEELDCQWTVLMLHAHNSPRLHYK